MPRTSYSGNAARLTAVGSMSSVSPGIGGTFSSNESASTFPDGSAGSFPVIVNRDQSDEEWILVSARTGQTFTVAQRGYNNTTAVDHAPNATLHHGWDATAANDLERHVYDTTHDDHPQYNLETVFDANSILKADADNVPVALTVPASTVVARLAAGGIVAGTMAQLRAILGSGTPDATTYLRGDGTWVTLATNTDRVSIGGFINTVAASLTNFQLGRLGGSVNRPWVAPRAGSVTGLSIAGSSARTAGTATFDVFKNGVAIGLTVVINATNTQFFYATQAAATDSFVAGDQLDVRVTTDGSWAPTTATWEGFVECQY